MISRDEAPDPEAEQRRAAIPRADPQAAGSSSPRPKRKSCKQARAAFFGSFRRFREFELNGDLRRAMRRETEMLFEHVVHDGPQPAGVDR